MAIDRNEMIARCKASGMDDEEASDFSGEMIAKIEAEAEVIYNRIMDRSRNPPPRAFRLPTREMRPN